MDAAVPAWMILVIAAVAFSFAVIVHALWPPPRGPVPFCRRCGAGGVRLTVLRLHLHVNDIYFQQVLCDPCKEEVVHVYGLQRLGHARVRGEFVPQELHDPDRR
jgi:hypothetical protein